MGFGLSDRDKNTFALKVIIWQSPSDSFPFARIFDNNASHSVTLSLPLGLLLSLGPRTRPTTLDYTLTADLTIPIQATSFRQSLPDTSVYKGETPYGTDVSLGKYLSTYFADFQGENTCCCYLSLIILDQL